MNNHEQQLFNDIIICPDKSDGSAGATGKKTKKPGRLRRTVLRVLLLLFIGAAVFFVGAMSWYARPAISQFTELTRLIDQILANNYHQLLTRPFIIRRGMDLDAARFLNRLLESGYRRSPDNHCLPGRFFIDGGECIIALRPRGGISRKISLRLNGSVVAAITDTATGRAISSFTLEPLVLTSFLQRIWEIRVPKTYRQIPSDLINAVLATEDQRYFQHPGIDTAGILRAAWVNFRAGRVIQGGSTITQQVVKILLKRKERTLEKKYTEALLALALERKYSKEELLGVYLNNVYLGQAAPFEIRGVGAAAEYILGKDLESLDLAECALLGGLIRSPNSASPLRNPKSAARRTNTVLRQMARMGDSLAAGTSVGKRMQRIRHQTLLYQQSWFFDQLERELTNKRILPADISNGRLVIHTTLDPWMQAAAYRKMRSEIARLADRKKISRGRLQGAITIMDPADGGVVALVGGSDYLKYPYNRAVRANRQIGSLVKPFIYLTALGGTGIHGRITQATIINDRPHKFTINGSRWKPHNYDHKYKGNITVRRALVESRNIPAILVGRKVGLKHIVALVQQLHINDNPPRVPALLLGALESTPLRMAAAYSAIANGGSRVWPHLVEQVEKAGKILWSAPAPEPILAPGPCFVVTDMLQEVMVTGTARRSGKMGFHQVAAGKTGTTNKLRDSWFAGFTPEMVTVCWVGRDDNKPARLTGSSGALPLWVATMKEIVGNSESQPFQRPPSIVFADIDQRTGKLSRDHSGSSARMAFVRGTAPGQYSPYQEKPQQRSDQGRVARAKPEGRRSTHEKSRQETSSSRHRHAVPWLMTAKETMARWFNR